MGPLMAEEKEQMADCQKWVDKAATRSMTVQFLLSSLKSLGCPTPEFKSFVNCVKCPAPMSGAFMMDSQTKKPEIAICANYCKAAGGYDFVEETLVHELIHSVDICRAKLPKDGENQLSSCRQIACMEIRASNMSGECRWGKEFMRGNGLSIQGQQKECVKRRAGLSMLVHEKCVKQGGKGGEGKGKGCEKYIDEVFGACYRDTYPFERHPDS